LSSVLSDRLVSELSFWNVLSSEVDVWSLFEDSLNKVVGVGWGLSLCVVVVGSGVWNTEISGVDAYHIGVCRWIGMGCGGMGRPCCLRAMGRRVCLGGLGRSGCLGSMGCGVCRCV
jgi:hypothetical protein